MSEFFEGAEVQEVTEPVDTQEEGVEAQEVAEPAEAQETDVAGEEHEKSKADAAFAEMRRAREAAEKRAAELEEQLSQQEATESILADIFGEEDPAIKAAAEKLGVDPDDLKSEIEAERELEKTKEENEKLLQELENIRVKNQMERDLADIQKIDPKIKTLQDLGEDFLQFKWAGMTGIDAYFAVKAKEAKMTPQAPDVIGKVNRSPAPKDFYTEAEVDAMSDDDIRKNLDIIQKSMSKW